MGYAAKNLVKEADFNILKEINYKEAECVNAFVDGSFRDKKNNGYGVFIKYKDIVIHQESKEVSFVDDELTNMTNIKAELAAVIRAVEVVKEKGYKEINIIYDCHSIVDMLVCKKIKSEFSLKYRNLINNYSKELKINFKKKEKEADHKVVLYKL